jgi:preprotein translocase subunit YajC
MFSSPAFAQAAAPVGGSTDPMVALIGFAPYLAIFAIFYFLLIRPQQKRVKAHRAMVDGVSRGDEVVTGGGIIGKASKVEDSEVEVEVASGVKLRVLKATLADVRKPGSAPATTKA